MTLRNPQNKFSVRTALLCSAIAAPLMTPVAASAQQQGDAEPCMQLQQAGDQINFEESGISQDEFNSVVDGNDPQQCTTWLAQVREEAGIEGEVAETERARVELQDEVVIEGKVIVDQQQPSVEVDEQAPEVAVANPSPDVNVQEGPIDVLIRQDAPQISMEMPQPSITIEQPAPEIIVTMPDPSVDVSNARPEVEVRQAEPEVRVSMAEPTVELELYQAEDPENSPGIEVESRQASGDGASDTAEPQVNINRSKAEITFEESQSQANVNVSRSEPSVSFEQAEPEVNVASSGEPTVNWSQSGEPKVTFRQNADDASSGQSSSDQARNDAQQGNDAESQTAAAMQSQESDSQNEQEQMARNEASQGDAAANMQASDAEDGGPAVRRDGYTEVSADEVEVRELAGTTVYAVQGDEISEAGELNLNGEDTRSVIVDISEFVEEEERQVEVMLSELTLLQNDEADDMRVYIDLSEDRLNDYSDAG
ncbi:MULTISPECIES: hypothetical protein [unclassified Roseovarius]|uniref:hypothetical protein n=1 Tax=unclassified Roseovarius TaxID=2614913 RepID=UPI00273D44F5|nr:hypothetical protein [Roseovarius sp. MMSF_3350]